VGVSAGLAGFIHNYPAERLYSDLRSDPATYGMLNLLWRSPDEMITACNQMGWDTVEQVGEWLTAVNDAVRSPTATK
jgi:hypothetical protein